MRETIGIMGLGNMGEPMAVAFTLAERSGVPPKTVYHVLRQTSFAFPLYQNYGRIIADQHNTRAGFKLPLGLKDVTLALNTAMAASMPMPRAPRVSTHRSGTKKRPPALSLRWARRAPG